MSEIRKSLESLADAIEQIDNKPIPRAVIKDRELSGNKIHGGKITSFSSTGITDEAAVPILIVKNDGVHVDSIYVKTVEGDVDVKGTLTATKLYVDEIVTDVKHQKTSPLEFHGGDKPAYNKGLLWTSSKSTKQFVLISNPDRVYSSESIDLHRSQSYMIGSNVVLSQNKLGNDVTESNLKKVGRLKGLTVRGEVNIDDMVRYHPDTEQFSIGTGDPKGIFSIESLDHQFIIDNDLKDWKLGTWTTSDLHIITDDTVRITVERTGKTTLHSQTVFKESVGVKVKNPQNDVDLTVAGAVRFQNKKQETGDGVPRDGAYSKGDIVWNTDPKPGSYIGWVCTREGVPGMWSSFGQIVN